MKQTLHRALALLMTLTLCLGLLPATALAEPGQDQGQTEASVNDQFNANDIRIKFRKDGNETTTLQVENNGGGESSINVDTEISFQCDYHGGSYPVTIPILLETIVDPENAVDVSFSKAENNMVSFTIEQQDTHQGSVTVPMTLTVRTMGTTNVTVRAKVNCTQDNPSHGIEGSGTLTLSDGSGGGQVAGDKNGKYTVVFQDDQPHENRAYYVHQNAPMIVPTADELGFEGPNGQVFLEWQAEGLQNPLQGGEVFTPTARTILTAVWTGAGNSTYSVTVDPGAGSGNPVTEQVTPGSQYWFKTAEQYGFTAPAGCELYGFDIEGSRQDFASGEIQKVTGDVTATALWKQTDTQACTITYVLGEGLGNATRTFYAGNVYRLEALENLSGPPDGKEFDHWEIGGVSYAPKAKLQVDGDLTVNAVWKDRTEDHEGHISLCREAERGVVSAPIFRNMDNQAERPVIGVAKGSTLRYTVNVWPRGEYWYILTSQSGRDVAEVSLSGNVLTVTGLKPGESEIDLVVSPIDMAMNEVEDLFIQGCYKVVVSEIGAQDESAEASAAAATALASAQGSTLAVDDFNLTYKTGATGENTTATVSEALATAVLSNLAGMEDELSQAEQTVLTGQAPAAYLYVDAEQKTAAQIDADAVSAIGNAVQGSTVGAYMNIGLYAQLGDCARRAVSDTGTADGVEITVDTSQFGPLAQGATREVTVVRYHDGEAQVLDNVTVNGTLATFQSSLFSPYAILYQDEGGAAVPGKQEQGLAFADASVTKTYGDADFTVAATHSTGDGAVTYAVTDGAAVAAVDNTGKVHILKAGTATITATAAETEEYAEKTASYELMVNKAALTIKAKNQSISVGGAVPTLEGEGFYTVTGLVGEDTLTTDPVLAYQKDGEPAESDNTAAGTYDIVPSGAAAGENYAISYVNGTLTISRPSSSGSSASTIPTSTVTVPISGDEESVNVTVKVKDDTATIASADVDKVLQAEEVGTVTIDVSALSEEVTEVVIPGAMVDQIADAMADGESSADGLEIILPTVAVTFDETALTAIAEQTGGKDLALNLDRVKVTELSSAQQDAVQDLEVEIVLDAHLTSGDQRISDFGGGAATVSVPYELKDGQTAAGLTVWYVAEDGTRTEVPASYDGKNILFRVSHFSNYVVAYDAEKGAASQRPYVDVPEDAWYYDAVYHCFDSGYFKGTDDIHFSPAGTITRAMFATVLYRIAGKPEVTGENPFTDIKDGSWYADAVIWAAGEKIIEGYGNGAFGTDDPVTREQMATILYRYVQSKGQGFTGSWMFLLNLADADQVSEWADEAMHWMVMNGIINGKGSGILDPKGTATRAEVAQIVTNFDIAETD